MKKVGKVTTKGGKRDPDLSDKAGSSFYLPVPGSRLFEKAVDRISAFDEDEPRLVLGPRKLPDGSFAVHAWLPRAGKAWIVQKGRKEPIEMEKVRENGLFRAAPSPKDPGKDYRIRYEDAAGDVREAEDPYAFDSQVGDLDLHLLGEGTHQRSFEMLGAHFRRIDGVEGTHFGVWAPNARAVSVVGDFNRWKEGAHPLQRVKFTGIWALFVPGLKEGDVYKYAVKGCDGAVRFKCDPYAFWAEERPRTGSRVADLGRHVWGDGEWMQSRARRDTLNAPLSVYELHLGSWKRKEDSGWGFMSYRELAHEVVDYVTDMGYTHVELMPVMEHPLDESWGYQVTSTFAPTSRFGSPADFMYFVDHCHQNGIGVILDWVPAHFPRDEHSLANFDGREVYAYEGWMKREHKDWGTFVFDYGRNEVRNFLVSNALFWLEKFHVDGLRVDAVASMLYLDYSRKPGEWEPNAFGGNENLEAVGFLKRLNEIVHGRFPGVLTIAEESTAWPGVSRPTYLNGLGFSMKWNMGWMHDTLDYFSKEPVYRKWHQGMLSFALMYAFSENFILPISHDEVVHGKGSLLGKMPGDEWQRFANLRLFLSLMFAMPGKQHLFMGCDLGQWSEWNCKGSVEWHLAHSDRHRQIQDLVRDLNRLHSGKPALHEKDFDSSGFEWIDFSDSEAGVLSFVRRGHDPRRGIVAVFNTTPVVRKPYRVGVPAAGYYREIFNSDSGEYGGSGVGNCGGFGADPVFAQGRPFSLNLALPPLAGLLFEYGEGV